MAQTISTSTRSHHYVELIIGLIIGSLVLLASFSLIELISLVAN